MRERVVLDFETQKIESKSYPPRPVGLAIGLPGRPGEYMAFGHPEGNNCEEWAARERYRDLCRDYDVIMHHAAFDVFVGEEWAQIAPQHELHCTMIQRFLQGPHAKSFGLKESAHELCGILPEARDAMRDWIKANVPEAKRKRKNELGEFIAQVPGEIVAPYACGDVTMPRALMDVLYPDIAGNGMLPAYERELKLIGLTRAMTRRGLKIDCARLERDAEAWEDRFRELTQKIIDKLGCPWDTNLDSGDQLADALDKAGAVTHWIYTDADEPKRSVAADALKLVLKDKDLYALLEERGVFKTCIYTFAKPWLEMADGNGRIHPVWNSTRRDGDAGGNKSSYGARTGRFSSTPNIQNIIKPGDNHPDWPHLRDYIIPEPGNSLFGRDYKQQENRILAHFEDGPLLEAYLRDPNMDVHRVAQLMIAEKLGWEPPRKHIKTIAFGILYGMGVAKAAKAMDTTDEIAKQIKNAYLAVFPGIKTINSSLRQRAKNNLPFYTWGHRRYYCEPPKFLPPKGKRPGKWMSFEYKMLNYLIQGSAADCTKEAMLRCADLGVDLLLNVHDELLGEAPIGEHHGEMAKMRRAMESVEFDVAMLSDGKTSDQNWGAMKSYDDNGYSKAA